MEVGQLTRRPSYWDPFIAAAQRETLLLQVCAGCNSVTYPPAEVCAECLGGTLEWSPVPDTARVLAVTEIRATNDDFFRPLLPVAIGSVRLDCGPVVIAFFPDTDLKSGASVVVTSVCDVRGTPVLVAHNQANNVTSEQFDWKGSSLERLFIK